jgi:hypothetical protein
MAQKTTETPHAADPPSIVDLILDTLLQNSKETKPYKEGNIDGNTVLANKHMVKQVLHQFLPHLDPANRSQPSLSANVTFGLNPDGQPFIGHTRLDTGEVTVTHLNPENAVRLGMTMIQYGTLAGVGWKPPEPPPEPTHEMAPIIQ